MEIHQVYREAAEWASALSTEIVITVSGWIKKITDVATAAIRILSASWTAYDESREREWQAEEIPVVIEPEEVLEEIVENFPRPPPPQHIEIVALTLQTVVLAMNQAQPLGMVCQGVAFQESPDPDLVTGLLAAQFADSVAESLGIFGVPRPARMFWFTAAGVAAHPFVFEQLKDSPIGIRTAPLIAGAKAAIGLVRGRIADRVVEEISTTIESVVEDSVRSGADEVVRYAGGVNVWQGRLAKFGLIVIKNGIDESAPAATRGAFLRSQVRARLNTVTTVAARHFVTYSVLAYCNPIAGYGHLARYACVQRTSSALLVQSATAVVFAYTGSPLMAATAATASELACDFTQITPYINGICSTLLEYADDSLFPSDPSVWQPDITNNEAYAAEPSGGSFFVGLVMRVHEVYLDAASLWQDGFPADGWQVELN